MRPSYSAARARGSGHAASDYDIGLYFKAALPLDTERLLAAAKEIADNSAVTAVTKIREWGPWIIGGAWLSVGGQRVDLLYRNADAVEVVMESCRAGIITMDYQPGHPHGFCSAIWMGEIAYCQPLRDPQDLINRLKSIALPYPQPLRDALIRRFQWEILFGIENAELAAARNEQTHIAGCVYRSLACVAQIVFARTSAISSTRRVLYGSSAVTADNSASGRAGTEIWRLIGNGALATAATSCVRSTGN